MKRTETQLELEIVDAIAYVTLNGPPKNEMDIAFFDHFSKFVQSRLGALRVDGMVVQGAGRHFSSGARVPEIEQLAQKCEDLVSALLRDNISSFLTLEALPFPVVAVIRGCCLGAGMELALACHHRIAEKNAVFSLPEVTYDLMPGCGGTIRLPALIDRGKAIELILSGRTVLADEALDLELVDRVVDRHRGLEAALELLQTQPLARENIR